MRLTTANIVVFASVLAACTVWISVPVGPAARGEGSQPAAQGAYHSPIAVAISPEGKTLYASDRTARNVAVLDVANKAKGSEIALEGEPRGLLLSADGGTLYVAERGTGTVAVINTAQKAVTARIPVGRWPVAVALAAKANRLYVCNQDRHTVSVVDLAQAPPKVIKEIAVVREPSCAAVTPDERFVVVANLLPHGVSTDPTLAAEVSIIDIAGQAVSANVKLPPGSTDVYGLCISPDGKWAYVVHQLSRFNLPVTQLERGWVNTYALSVIDIAQGQRKVSMLLDDLTQGASNPYAVVCSKDGAKLWICHSGVQEVSTIRIGYVHELLGGKVPDELASLKDGTQPNIWVRIQQDPKQMAELENDLTALYIAGAIQRFPSGGLGPRALALSPDEQQLLVANYYSGSVAILDPNDGRVLGQVSLGPQPEPDAVRRGDLVFHDARHAFQRWHSCASCHPNDGRVDGLRWDFLRDGIGNPKDTPSLVYMHLTEPFNRLGLRETPRQCAKTGLLVGHMIVPTEETVDDLLAYLVSLTPEPSPHLTPSGELSAAAQRGKAVFDGKAECAECHPAPYYTDKRKHEVGTHTPNDPRGGYDTPALIEGYRTAPYLHDGRALTLKDVLTVHNENDAHGKIKGLSEQEIEDLVAYLLSL